VIAGELNISYETVCSHVKKIYEKLHVASLTEVVAKAINQKIVLSARFAKLILLEGISKKACRWVQAF
jgi:hypothetical protein